MRALASCPRAEASTASSMFSNTDRLSNTLGVWNLRPIPRLARAGTGSGVMRSPWYQMSPALGLRWPEIMLMKVVLPAPFGPMMQRSSLLASWKSTWSVATRP